MEVESETRVYAVFGERGVGKSSFVRDVFQNSQNAFEIEVGSGHQGLSTTKKPQAYLYKQSSLTPHADLILIDTPGLVDRRDDYPYPEVKRYIESIVFEKTRKNHLDGIILIESMRADGIGLKACINRLEFLFKTECEGSIVILGTKGNLINEKARNERRKQIEEDGRKRKADFMPFQTSYQVSAVPQEDFRRLKEKLSALRKLTLKDVEARRNREGEVQQRQAVKEGQKGQVQEMEMLQIALEISRQEMQERQERQKQEMETLQIALEISRQEMQERQEWQEQEIDEVQEAGHLRINEAQLHSENSVEMLNQAVVRHDNHIQFEPLNKNDDTYSNLVDNLESMLG